MTNSRIIRLILTKLHVQYQNNTPVYAGVFADYATVPPASSSQSGLSSSARFRPFSFAM